MESIVIAVHVDDCTVVGSTLGDVEKVKNGVRSHVEVTDLGALHWILGIEGQTLALSQRAYLDSIIRRYGSLMLLRSNPRLQDVC